MYDYSLHLQTKQKIEELRRANQRRQFLRDFEAGRRAQRDAHKPPTSRNVESREHTHD